MTLDQLIKKLEIMDYKVSHLYAVLDHYTTVTAAARQDATNCTLEILKEMLQEAETMKDIRDVKELRQLIVCLKID